MRVAPVGLWARDAEEAFRVGCELAAITHGHPSGYLSAGFLSALIGSLRGGRSLLESIGDARSLLRGWPDHEECLEAVDAALDLARERPEPSAANIRTLGGGWVGEEALAIAIYCALGFPGDFRLGVLAAVNHGGDSDSTGAIAGNILGAMLGKEAIPREWVDNLELAWIVRQVAADLFTAVAGRGGRAASGPKGEPGPRVDPGAGLDPDLSLAERYPVTV
jgi:ADP-ribosylglycohydrolase